MPDKASYIDKIPMAMCVLRRAKEPLDRAAVEQLLEVGGTQARKIMAAAGTKLVGKNFMTEPGALALYLEKKGDRNKIKAEWDRQTRFARALDGMVREHLERPYGPEVIIEGWKPNRQPIYEIEGVEFREGRLVVDCPDGAMQLAARLYAVADLIAKDRSWVDERLGADSLFGRHVEPLAPVNPKPAKSGVPDFVREELEAILANQ